MNQTLALREKAIYHEEVNGEVKAIYDDNFIDAGELAKAIHLIKRVSATTGDLYHPIKSKNGGLLWNSHVVKPRNRDALSLLFLLSRGRAQDLANVFPHYQINPYLRSLINNEGYFSASHVAELVLKKKTADIHGSVKLLNCFVEAVRQDTKLPEFKREIKNFERSANKNHLSLMQYIKDLFAQYSKLLVLRTDLEYRTNESTRRSFGLELEHHEIARHRDAFFKKLPGYLKEKLGKDVWVGFVWKLEYGPVNGWHYHSLIFLDGQKTQKDVALGQLIGEYWNTEIAEGKGRYYNCNANKAPYIDIGKLGIGLIDYRDKDLRHNLENTVAMYLTKVDLCVKLIQPEGVRAMGRGVRRLQNKARRGRPRQLPALEGSLKDVSPISSQHFGESQRAVGISQ